MHPVLATIGVTAVIRMSLLQIDGILKVGGVIVPWVARQTSDAPIAATLNSYIAGPKGPLPQGLVPAVAASLLFGGNPIRLGQFDPPADAYRCDLSGTCSTRAAWAFVPNPFTGPGAYPEAVDFAFANASQSKYGAQTIKRLINTPILLPSGLCQRNTYYFTNTTALPMMRSGNVTFGPAADGFGVLSGRLMKASPDGSGFYQDVEGLSACAQAVGYNIEDCESAATSVDPTGLS